MTTLRHPVLLLSLLGLGASCSLAPVGLEWKAAVSDEKMAPEEADAEQAPAASSAPSPMREEGRVGKKDALSKLAIFGAGARGEPSGLSSSAEKPRPPEDEAPSTEAAVRAWFPETFLWEPLVVTDAAGTATADVRVPDSLTDWRVLALAHSRDGEQAGGIGRLSSTLPAYADVVLPAGLLTGERIRLPVQVVNNTGQPLASSLVTTVEGAAQGGGTGSLGVAPWGSAVRYFELEARAPGEALVTLRLGTTDRVERTLRISPAGRRVSTSLGGTLAAPRQLHLPPGSPKPAASSLELVVLPGPISFVMAEIEAAQPRIRDLPSAAYAYALSGEGRALALKWGIEPGKEGFPKAEALRALRLRAYQTLVKGTRSARGGGLFLALEAARTQPEDPLAKALADRLAAQIASLQSPDGSFASSLSGENVTLDRSLAWSAEASRLAGDRQRVVTHRARGFVARNVAAVQEPYTAALLLGSGVADEATARRLRAVLDQGLASRKEGERCLVPGGNAVRVDGSRPSPAEASARAILALREDPEARPLVHDLADCVFSAWSPGLGFGDPQSGLVVLSALGSLLGERPPESVEIVLSAEGREYARRRLELAAGLSPAVLSLPPSDRALPDTWRLEAIPAVPGLSYAVTRNDWVPVAAGPSAQDLLRVSCEGPARVGKPLPCTVVVPLSRQQAMGVELELPTGFEPDAGVMGLLASSGRITDYVSRKGAVRFTVPASTSELASKLEMLFVPSFMGRFHGMRAIAGPGGAPSMTAAAPDVEVGS
jgi:hypothetical protein